MRYLSLLIGALLLSSCAVYPPTQAGYTAKRGINNVAPKAKENRH